MKHKKSSMCRIIASIYPPVGDGSTVRRPRTLPLAALGAVVICAGTGAAQAQTTYTYYTGTSTAYMNASHWTLASGTTSTKFPGVDANASSTADGAPNDIAAIGTIGFNPSFNFGINFGTSGTSGLTGNSAASGALQLGAFDFLSTLQSGFSIGNSATVATTTGVLTLNGITVNNIANTILSNEGSPTLSFVPNISSGGAMSIALGNTTTNTIQVNGSGGLAISTVISGAGRGITVNSAGTGALTLSGANTYSGGTTLTLGTLLVNGTGTVGTSSGLGTGPVTVNGGLLGGSGRIGGATTVNQGATIQGGAGDAITALTLSSTLTLNTGSIVQIALSSNFNHSTLATGGTTFNDPNQAFNFLFNAGTTIGTYTNIITGLTSDPMTEGTWTVTSTNAIFAANFSYNASGGIDLNVTAVPEPTTVLGGVLLIGAAGWSQRRRLRGMRRAA